ncbi:ATPase component of ABC transporter with duplicated ATPase domains [Ligilactobacillus salitolerans]|uniref:ATPase component of ABC transporter with duplicated ATPase domains n=1 Tax=Ligilactobacillus salitolerans TaxID=1808352 RepID=A0A401IVI7_9LACO|nr:ATP-binding cassette domain-containing protein [Ligilactobacillus salitolerans]GBG95525.1 ATPase component of ABC transporter with duplicated ATPase domains [Ligilactobacillus salitolerans]
MLLLQVQQAARVFAGDPLFQKIDLNIQSDSRIALVGPNGAGKSTLIKMIIGQSEPDEGQIVKRKNLTIGYLAQDTGLESDDTIYAEMLKVFAGLIEMEKKIHQLEKLISSSTDTNSTRYQELLKQYDQLMHDFSERNGYGYEAEIRSVLHGFHFYEADYDKKVASLSGGQKTRLALARLLLEKRDLLILDEPTNHLDIETLQWLENYLQGYPGALLLVSHDRYFLDKIVTTVCEISHKQATTYPGNYTDFVKQKQAKQRREWKEYEKQQTQINKLQDFVDKNLVRATTSKRAQSRQKQLDKIQRLDRPSGDEQGPHFSFTPAAKSGSVVLTVKDGYIGHDAKTIAGPINFELRKNKVLALVGQNGIGKSTLLESIIGQLPFISGSAKFGANVQYGYYDQEQHGLHSKKTVLNEIWDDHPTTPEKDIRSLLGGFLFKGDDVKKLVHNLSGGEKARLLLTKLAMQHDNLLILDEPTNHLDINSKEVLEQAVQDFDGTVLFVSHDRYFINQTADEIIEISPKGSTLYLGNYDYYLAKKEELQLIAEQKAQEASQQTTQEKTEPASKAKTAYSQSKDKQKQQRKLERRVAALEEEVDQLDAQKSTLETVMTQPETFNDPTKMQDLQKQLEELTTQLQDKESEWEASSLELETFLEQA